MAPPHTNHRILDDAATCPAALNLGKTNAKNTRRLVEKLVKTTIRPKLKTPNQEEGNRLSFQRAKPVSSTLLGPLKIKSSSGKQRSVASVSATSSVYSRSVHSLASQSSYYSYYSGYSRSTSSMGSLSSINSAGTFDSFVSYVPSQRTATWGPLLLGIVLFTFLTVHHMYMEPHNLGQHFNGDSHERRLIRNNPNEEPSLLRGALLNPVYLKQDFLRRDDYGQVLAVASAMETPDEPKERKLLSNRQDKRIKSEPCPDEDGMNSTSKGIGQVNCTSPYLKKSKRKASVTET